MKRPNKKYFERYQNGLVFKTVDLIKYIEAQELYIDSLEALIIPDVLVPKGTLFCENVIHLLVST